MIYKLFKKIILILLFILNMNDSMLIGDNSVMLLS